MIELEFIESCDIEIIGKIKLGKKTTFLGNSKGDDVIISDKSLGSKYFKIEVFENSLLCSCSDNQPYHSNGKKISGNKIHKEEDIIKIGSTSFKIISINSQSILDQDKSLQNLYSDLIKKNPYAEDILKFMKNELLLLDYLANQSRKESKTETENDQD